MKFSAKWITSPKDPQGAAYTYCKEFDLCGKVKKATLNVSSIGLYSAAINGKKVGKGVLTPGWTSYQHRVQYQTYDVTNLLSAKNEITVGVGPGWAVGFIGYHNTNHYFGDRPAIIAQIDVTYEDGTTAVIASGTDWTVKTSHVLSSEIYHGETVDMTAPVRKVGNAVETTVRSKLVPQVGEWITEQERLAPVELIRTPKGETVIDFGQNMTGYVEVRVKGPKGSRIVMHHAEVLDKEGNFYTANFRAARNENIYVLSGKEDVFKPTYCFQGFRYIELVEYPFEEVDLNCFRAVAVNSEMTRTGFFRCGNEKINQLYHNVVWGQKSNYLDIPTDCPQRDERLGWTGDAQAFCRTAAINFDIEKFFEKWLGDMALEQGKDGSIPMIVPHCFASAPQISAAWADVACIAPWEIYLAYGNKALLKKNYPMMKNWVRYLHDIGPEEFLWIGGNHYGDWLAMDNGPDVCVGATPTDFIASAFFAHSTNLVIKAGKVLGEDVSEYEKLYKNVVAAVRGRYLKNGKLHLVPNGWKEGDDEPTLETQTAYVLLLHFDLCTDAERPVFAARLAQMIRENGDRMTTGFVGTPYLLHVLAANGYSDVAYTLLMQEKTPSWLYSVCHGATTMWEHWNSIKEDGTFWSTTMNSFNHYAYGAVFDWIFGVAVGIKPTEEAPGYEKITLAPIPDKSLGFADASIRSRHGEIRAHWYYKGNDIYYEFRVPEGVTAYLRLPDGYTETLSGGDYRFTEKH